MILLIILGTIDDEIMAADIALHFWYSIFLPMEYRIRITAKLFTFLQQVAKAKTASAPLGPGPSTLSVGILTETMDDHFSHYFSSVPLSKIRSEYDRVRQAPSQIDFRDRMYVNLKPSHRVAFQEYRRIGIILPFGATTAHFDYPNLSLFSSEGKWLQTDYADPLEGWK